METKEKPQKLNAMREFLTIEELRQLMATPCRYDIVKKAFLFSCFTGLRYSDMMTLKWSEIHKAADGKTLYIEHQQVKTKNTVTIPLSNEALKWMPRKSKDEERVFHQLRITSTTVEVGVGRMDAEGRNTEAHHLPLLQAYGGDHVADPRRRPLHGEQDTRTP